MTQDIENISEEAITIYGIPTEARTDNNRADDVVHDENIPIVIIDTTANQQTDK